MRPRWKSSAALGALVWLLSIVLGGRPARACVGEACINLWSTEPAAGALAVRFDFSEQIPVYESFCTSGRSTCLFTAIEPGFMAPPSDTPPEGLSRLTDGTTVRLKVVAIDAGLALNINGNKLSQAGESALLGTMPTIHVHPAWQVVLPGSEVGRELHVSFKVYATVGAYAESATVTATVIVVSTDPTPTPVPTPTPSACAGDCDNDGTVTMDELMTAVAMGLSAVATTVCEAGDTDHDAEVSIDELTAAVGMANSHCQAEPLVEFATLQDSIFTPRCATPYCHDSISHTGNLNLELGQSHRQLVNVEPDILSARDAGFLRVVPGDPTLSFLLTKLTGPPPSQGSRMPLIGEPLSVDEIDQIRRWILQGATN